MAAPVGATIGRYSRSTFGFGRTSDGCGQGYGAWPVVAPGFGNLSSAERTRGNGLGRFDQSTFRSTIPHPTRRKRRAGGRVTTDSDM